MVKATHIISQEIKAEVYCKTGYDFGVRIVHNMLVAYDDNINRDENETIIDFTSKYFRTALDADKWMKKDKLFKATLRATLIYTPLTVISK